MLRADETRVFTNRNIYILGAGFSADAGLPLLSNFLDVMRDALGWLEENKWRAEAESVRRVLRFRLESAGAAYRAQLDLDNIEDLFSLSSAIESDADRHHVSRAIAATLHFAHARTANRLLGATIEHHSNFQPRKEWGRHGVNTFRLPYYQYCLERMIGGLSPSSRQLDDNVFISFNYDTIIETAGNELGIPIDFGFPEEGFRAHSSTPDRTVAKNGSENKLRLYKLHGSMAWGYASGDSQRVTGFGSYEEARQHSEHPCLTPPTWRKGDANWFGSPWRAAVEALEGATRIYIIGFSMPPSDQHFRFLMAAGLRRNISLRGIYVVNKDVGSPTFQSRLAQVFPERMLRQGMINCAVQDLQSLTYQHVHLLSRDLHTQLRLIRME